MKKRNENRFMRWTNSHFHIGFLTIVRKGLSSESHSEELMFYDFYKFWKKKFNLCFYEGAN